MDGDWAGEGGGDSVGEDGSIRRVKAESGGGKDRKRGRDRHIVVERGVGVGGLKGGYLCVAVAAVRGNDDTCTGIRNAVRRRSRRGILRAEFRR